MVSHRLYTNNNIKFCFILSILKIVNEEYNFAWFDKGEKDD